MARGLAAWPWISPVLAAIAAATPPGRDFLYSAFISSDQLGRNIARPLVFWAMGVVALAVLCEFLLRSWLRKG